MALADPARRKRVSGTGAVLAIWWEIRLAAAVIMASSGCCAVVKWSWNWLAIVAPDLSLIGPAARGVIGRFGAR